MYMYVCVYVLAPSVPDSALPLGMTQEDGSTQVIPEEPSEFLLDKSYPIVYIRHWSAVSAGPMS